MTKSTKSTNKLSLVGIAGALCIAVFLGLRNLVPDIPKTPQEEREDQLSKYFSAWDGSNPTLERLIKNAMSDPDSYEHIETVYWDMTDHIIVRTVYSGNNAFGERVKKFIKAKLDNEGKLVEIIEEGAGNG